MSVEPRPFSEEDPQRASAEDAAHWIAVYSQLLGFMEDLTQRGDPIMWTAIVTRGTFYRRRLELWRERLAELAGSQSRAG